MSRASVLAVGLLLAASQTTPAPAANFAFVQTSDTHFAASAGPGSHAETCASLWREIGGLSPRPAFVINSGDVCEYGTDEEYACYRKALVDLPIPHHDAPGNHDVRWNPRGKEGFVRGVKQPLSQSWDHEGVHFVVLDSTVLLQHWGHFDAAMLRWLASDLAGVGTDRPVVLAFHHWIGRDAQRMVDNEDALLDVVAPYNVRLWLIGHGHSDILWNINGAPAVMVKGLYQGSYNLVEVTKDRLRVLRRTAESPSPTAEVVSVPLARQKAPHWTADVRRAGANVEVTVRGDLPAESSVAAEFDGGKAKTLDRSVDGWRATLPAGGLIAGEHTVTFQASLPDGRTYSRQVPLRLTTPGAPEPCWTVNVGGEVQSKLVRAGDSLFVPCMGGDLIALDPATGRERWRFHTGGPVFSTPLVADGVVYIGSADHNIYAVDARTGNQRWKASTDGGVFAGAAIAGWTVCIASTDRKVYGLDASTGAVRWTAPVGGMCQSAAATDGKRFFVGCWDNMFRALDVATGREVWKDRFGRSMAYSPAIGSPTVGDGKVFVTSNDGILHAMDAATGKVAWEVDGPKLGYSGPLFRDGRIYNASLTDAGVVHRFDAATGERRWKRPTGSVIYDSSCAWGDIGAVYVGCVDGTFSAIRAEDGDLLWQYRLGPGHVLASPATDAGRVYIGSLSGRVTALPLSPGH